MQNHWIKKCEIFQDDNSTGRVGPPLQGVQVKLIDWDEGNYRVTDLPNPRGLFSLLFQFRLGLVVTVVLVAAVAQW